MNHQHFASPNNSAVASHNDRCLTVLRAVCVLGLLLCNEAIAAKKIEPFGADAKWIGLDGVEQVNFLENSYAGYDDQNTALSWIWFPQGEPEKSAAPATNCFRHEIVIPASKPVIKEVHFRFTGDSECRAWINGVELGAQRDYHKVKDVDVTYRVKVGTNLLCLMGINDGTKPKPAGVVALLEAVFVRGDAFMYWTDEQWKVSPTSEKGWTAMDFDDSKWVAAKRLGLVGMEPWGKVRVPEERRLPARYLRKEFVIAKKLRRATICFSGLGWSVLSINGSKVGDDVLSPNNVDYTKEIPYLTLDVKKQLHPGTNAIGVILGNGSYYAPRSEVITGKPSYGWPKLRLQLRLEYSDGTVSKVVSDESWLLTVQGPIRANNIYDGEECDANFDLGHWSEPGYNAVRLDTSGNDARPYNATVGMFVNDNASKRWQAAQIVAAPPGKLTAQRSKPLRIAKTRRPISCAEPKPGVFVFDMGRDIVGWCRLKVQGPAVTQVVLRHAEKLKADGMLDLTGSNGEKATDVYVLRGQGVETWEPQFTCHRFRYVEVTGYPGKPTGDAIEGRVLTKMPSGL